MFWVSQDDSNNKQWHLIFVEEPSHKALEGDEKTRARIDDLEVKLTTDMELIKSTMFD
jgi:hypothetical protein